MIKGRIHSVESMGLVDGPGITDGDEHIKELAGYLKGRLNLKRVELLGYHTLGVEKYHQVGISYPLEDIPSPRQKNINKLSRINK